MPGPLHRDDPHSYTIAANVKRFESSLMHHEYRPGFDPQHEKRYVFAAPEKTEVSVKHFFGAHNAGTILTDNDDTNQTAKLVYDNLYKFCKGTGSLPIDGEVPKYIKKDSKGEKTDVSAKELIPQERFKLYCDMKENEWLYAKGRQLHVRTIFSNKGDFVVQPELFINQEHRELFKQLYPKVFHWFFEKNCQPEVKKEDVLIRA